MPLTAPSGILVVEDDRALSSLVFTVLRRDGTPVDIANDGLEALEKISARRYSLVLLDLMMPKLDGYGVIAKLADMPMPERPIVIVLSAVAENELPRLDGQVVTGILRKPFDIHQLRSVVAACVATADAGENVLPFDPSMRAIPFIRTLK